MKLLNRYSQKRVCRSARISQELKKAISGILRNNFRDPRINFLVTVSMVKVSRDLSCAKVFISYINLSDFLKKHTDINNISIILDVLQKSSGYIRSMLCKIVQLRKIPELIFYNDNSLIEGMKISALLQKI